MRHKSQVRNQAETGATWDDCNSAQAIYKRCGNISLLYPCTRLSIRSYRAPRIFSVRLNYFETCSASPNQSPVYSQHCSSRLPLDTICLSTTYVQFDVPSTETDGTKVTLKENASPDELKKATSDGGEIKHEFTLIKGFT